MILKLLKRLFSPVVREAARDDGARNEERVVEAAHQHVAEPPCQAWGDYEGTPI